MDEIKDRELTPADFLAMLRKRLVLILILAVTGQIPCEFGCNWPGERARVRVMSVDRDQARVIMDYIRSLLKEVPMLAPLVQRETAESLELSNRVTIKVG